MTYRTDGNVLESVCHFTKLVQRQFVSKTDLPHFYISQVINTVLIDVVVVELVVIGACINIRINFAVRTGCINAHYVNATTICNVVTDGNAFIIQPCCNIIQTRNFTPEI